MVHFDSGQTELEGTEEQKDIDITQFSKLQEAEGKLEFNAVDEKLMHSVLENDKEKIDDGKMIEDALNQGMGAFTPDMMFEQLVKNFKLAKKLYGESLIRRVSGYSSDYINKNKGIPEFKKELKERIQAKVSQLQKSRILDKDGIITEKGIELASLVMYMQELDHIVPKGISGERIHKKRFIYGDKGGTKVFRKGDRYKDIAIKQSIKTAIRRGHDKLAINDLKTFERKSKGECYIIYALDASGSMRGDKISTCKRAGVALAYNAIKNKDSVGLMVFGSEIKDIVEPTKDFTRVLKSITSVKASSETNIGESIMKAVPLFPRKDATRHLLLLTDAMPTKSDTKDDPEKATLEAASVARSNGITISLIGINLEKKGKKMAEKIVEIGGGKLYAVKNLEEVDKLVLTDYYSFA